MGVFALVLVCALVGVGAFLIAREGGEDLDAARAAGAAEGHAEGSAAGSEAGFAQGFREGRKESFDLAYEKAYEQVYRAAFDEAGLEPPKNAKVKAP
jgi:flagellar biosynthesis/type III secretory pathway protein FliH